ncbi:MAG TPA: SCP2 sterol-binding domain-containing protein [Candidatus Nanoarchaeia archaeon]|nr:SCP2 sterol-binding domain-containing protein [Candidatus Nanoarchaeia archaeon]
MEAATPKEFFEKVLPLQFKPEKAAGINVVVQITITGETSGEWTVIIKNQNLMVSEGVHESPNLSLKMTSKDFIDLVGHKISAEKAFFSGKVHFKGNIALALKLRDAGFL